MMRKRSLMLLALLLCLCLTGAALAETAGFTFGTGVTFGMTQEEVTACLPGAALTADDTAILLEDAACADLSAAVLYDFTEARLTRIAVFLREDHDDPALYLTDYDTVEQALTSSYGAPTTPQQQVWAGAAETEDLAEMGAALLGGTLTLHTQFTCADGAVIWHTVYQSDGVIAHAVLCYAPGTDATAAE